MSLSFLSLPELSDIKLCQLEQDKGYNKEETRATQNRNT